MCSFIIGLHMRHLYALSYILLWHSALSNFKSKFLRLSTPILNLLRKTCLKEYFYAQTYVTFLLSRNSLQFLESATSFSCSQEPAACPYPEPDKSSSRQAILFLWMYYNIVLPSMPRPSKGPFSSRFFAILYYSFQLMHVSWHINPLKTKLRPLYLKAQSIPRWKHFSSRL